MVRWLALLVALVTAVPAAAADLFVEATAMPADPYVQAEVRYTLRLYRASSLQTGYFFDPEVPDAILEVLAEDDPKAVERDGRPMQMIERRYVLNPQRSGRLEIPPPAFSGRESFVKGETLVLAVRPKPKEVRESWWLPARKVTVAADWQLPPAPFRAGEPLEQVVTVTAEGLTGAQIPPLPIPPGARVLRAESGHDRDAAGTTLGWRRERRLWLPAGAGPLEIPALDLPWWDLGADRERHAVLAGRTFAIAPAAHPAPPPIPAPPPSPTPKGESVAERLSVMAGPVVGVLVFAFGLWLADRFLSVPRRVLGRRRKAALRAFAGACRTGDAPQARRALLHWCDAWESVSPAGLLDLARRLDGRSAKALRTLDAHLYGPKPPPWDGTEAAAILLPALRRMVPGVQVSSTAGGLPPLDPEAVLPGLDLRA